MNKSVSTRHCPYFQKYIHEKLTCKSINILFYNEILILKIYINIIFSCEMWVSQIASFFCGPCLQKYKRHMHFSSNPYFRTQTDTHKKPQEPPDSSQAQQSHQNGAREHRTHSFRAKHAAFFAHFRKDKARRTSVW